MPTVRETLPALTLLEPDPVADPVAPFSLPARAFRDDMRRLGGALGGQNEPTPEALAERFCRNAVSVARQHQAGQGPYLAELQALVAADLNTPCEPPYGRFVAHLLRLLDDAAEAACG